MSISISISIRISMIISISSSESASLRLSLPLKGKYDKLAADLHDALQREAQAAVEGRHREKDTVQEEEDAPEHPATGGAAIGGASIPIEVVPSEVAARDELHEMSCMG